MREWNNVRADLGITRSIARANATPDVPLGFDRGRLPWQRLLLSRTQPSFLPPQQRPGNNQPYSSTVAEWKGVILRK
jgi:hypothetical protein